MQAIEPVTNSGAVGHRETAGVHDRFVGHVQPVGGRERGRGGQAVTVGIGRPVHAHGVNRHRLDGQGGRRTFKAADHERVIGHACARHHFRDGHNEVGTRRTVEGERGASASTARADASVSQIVQGDIGRIESRGIDARFHVKGADQAHADAHICARRVGEIIGVIVKSPDGRAGKSLGGEAG